MDDNVGGFAEEGCGLGHDGHAPGGVRRADNLAEIDRRIERANPQFRREGRAWRDLAAQALARA